APACAREARCLGDVFEGAVGLLMIEGDHGVAALLVAVDGRAVDDENVEATVVIAIEKAYAATHGFDDVAFFASGDVGDGQPDGLGDVFEFWDGGEAGAISFGWREFSGGW